MEEGKKQNPMEVKGSVIIAFYQKLTNREKNCLKAYIIWFLVHCVLLASGENGSSFYPWHYSDLEWKTYEYGLPEFIVYVALIPIILCFAYSFYKGKKK